MKVKHLKKEKVKRSRIILSAILTIAIALLSLGFGAYLGHVTLSINYVTIGTMTNMVGGLLVVAVFFIFFGCIGGVISLKELFISSRNEEKFSAYKGALISAIIYYVIIAIICIVGFIVSLVSYVPSNFTWTILALSVLSLLLCAGAFYCVLRELKEHKKNKKNNQAKTLKENPLFNMNMTAGDIRKYSEFYAQTQESEINKRLKERENKDLLNKEERNFSEEKVDLDLNKNLLNKTLNDEDKKRYAKEVLFGEDIISGVHNVSLKQDNRKDIIEEKAKKLEELKKFGVINEQEYVILNRILKA